MHTLALVLLLVRSVTFDDSPGLQIFLHEEVIISSSQGCHAVVRQVQIPFACEHSQPFFSLPHGPSPAKNILSLSFSSLDSFLLSFLLMRIQSLTANSAVCVM